MVSILLTCATTIGRWANTASTSHDASAYRQLRSVVLMLLVLCGVPMSALAVDVVLATDAGDIVVRLYPDKAPVTAGNFLRYVDAGLYTDGQIYRVVRLDNQPDSPVKIEVIQGGRGLGAYDAERAPAFPPIAHETTEATGLAHVDGALSMARLAPGTATSEFFICVGDQQSLDFGGDRNPDGQGFAVFGQVVQGMDVVRRIQGGSTAGSAPAGLQAINGQVLDTPVVIKGAERR